MQRLLPAGLILVALAAGHGLAMETNRFGRDVWTREIQHLGVDPADVVYPFSVSPEMERWVEETLRRSHGSGRLEKLEAMQAALFEKDFNFEYDSDLTLIASEAFDERRGNCMSFTALFVSLARTAGIHAFLMSVQRDPEVDREDGLVVLNRHAVAAFKSAVGEVRIFDFYVRGSEPYAGERVIDDVTATAMYHTNLGGSAIRLGDLTEAIRHLDFATTLAPDWAPGWINMGVARHRNGEPDGALDAYRKALGADPHDSSALTNMAVIYEERGLYDEADNALRAAAKQTTNPFTLIAIADAEMVRGRYDAARRYLRKAKKRYRSEPEVYRALARLAVRQGEMAKARKHQRRADELGGGPWPNR